jgi:AAA domain
MNKNIRWSATLGSAGDYFGDADPRDDVPPATDESDYGSNGKAHDDSAFGEAEQPKRLIQSSRQFVARFVPMDFIVDGLLQEAFLYSLTGATGAGKTTITLRLAASVALGIVFANRETKKRRALYLAAENPVDTRMRWIALAQQMDFDADTIEVYFVEGVFKISQMAARLKAEALLLGGEFGMVIVDTSPVFYEGDDENNRNQQGKHAEMLRSLIDVIPGKPTVIANCHPVKNASPDNLSPAGGGNFLNQVDGNLTAAKADSTIELHWQGKFRGPDFAPMHFMLRTVTHERLVTSTGRLLPTVVCDWISDTAKEEIAKQKSKDEDLILTAIDEDPKASQASLAVKMKWMLYSGEPNKMKVSRVLKALKGARLITETRSGRFQLTGDGRKALKGSQSEA